jgi:tetratricopeptide (TPR) repeat protein
MFFYSFLLFSSLCLLLSHLCQAVRLNDTARKQTVRIENSGGNGSGVIVAREGSSYYVLTAKHVVQDEKGKAPTHQKFTNNQIVTYDQDRHSLTSTIVAENMDLAVVKFSTKSNYPLARLNEHNPNNDELVFVGGFPDRKNIDSPLWQWQLNPGFILDRETGQSLTQNNLSFSNGYDLYYGNVSYGGMSGGPVFDTDGQVIGIHGRAESTDQSTLGGSLGISIQSFTGLLDKLQVRPGLLKITKNSPTTLNDRDRQTVVTAMNNIPQPEAEADGKRWLAYGNQLTRTLEFEKAVVAFDRAIGKGEVLNGNYGKTLSLLILGKYEAAKTAIERAIALVPNDKYRPKYYYFWKYQSRILARLNKTDEALKAINEAIRLESNDLNLEIEKATILVQTKQYAAALAIYEKMSRQPSDYMYFNRGIIKGQSGDVNGALADLDRAIKINPNYVTAYFARSLLKVSLKDINGAIADLDRAIKINPNDNIAYWLRAKTYLELKNYKNALADSSRAIELSNVKGFVKAFRPTSSISLQAYIIRCQANLELEKFKDAIADADRASELIKTMKGLTQSDRDNNLAVVYFLRGAAKFVLEDKPGATSDLTQAANLFRQQGNMELYQQAKDILENKLNKKLATIPSTENNPKLNNDPKVDLADYNKKIALAPQNASLYVDRGILKVDKFNDLKGALADYNQAISLDPKYALAYFARGYLKERLDDANGAISDYDKAIAFNVNMKLNIIYELRGNLKNYKLNDSNGALADYNKAIALDPKSVDVYLNRGNLKNYKLNDLNGALADYDKTIALAPQSATAYIQRGVLKYQGLNDSKGAMTDINKSIELDPKSIDGYYNRGDFYYSLGNKTAAIADFQKVIALDKSSIVGSISQGVIYLEQGALIQAIGNFDRAAKTIPDTPDLYKYRGLAYRRQGNKPSAIQDWRKAAKGYKQVHAGKDYNTVRGWLKELGATE